MTFCCNGAVVRILEIDPKRGAIGIALAIFSAIVLLVVFQPGQQSAAGVELGDTNVWVEHGIDGELLGVNSATGEVTTRISISEPGTDFIAHPHGDGVVVLDPTGNLVSLVSASRLSVVGQIEVPLDEETNSSNSVVFGQSEADSDIVIIEEEQLVTVSPENSQSSSRVLPVPIASAQTGSGDIFGFSASENLIIRIASGEVTSVANVLGTPDGEEDQRQLVASGGRVFAIDPNRLSMSEVSLDDGLGSPICMRSAADGAVHGGSGVDGEPVVVSLNPNRGVLAISTADGGCRDVDVDVEPGEYGPPVVHEGVAYLPFYEQGRLIGVSLEDGETVTDTRFGTPGQPFELDVFGSKVWANERLGPLAVMIDDAEVTAIPKVTALLSREGIDGQGDGSTLVVGDIDQGGLRILGDAGEPVISLDGDRVADTIDEDSPLTDPQATEGDLDFEIEPFDFETGVLGIAIEAADGGDGDGIGLEDQGEGTATLSEALLANFTISSTEVTVGEPIRFTDTSLGTPVTWSWTFGDGTAAAVPDPEKIWTVEGTYAVTLTVTNAEGTSSTQSAEIRVAPEDVLLPPNADFTFSSDAIEVGETVTFENRTTGPTDSILWDFGDGTTSTDEVVTHTFERPGLFNVVLTATNEAGSSTSSIDITVLAAVEAPTAAIAPFPRTVLTDQFVTLESVSLNAPTTFVWGFGDGNSDRGESVRYAWSEPGEYRLFLQVENSAGSDRAIADITVESRVVPPVAQFTQSATNVLVGEAVLFTNTSLNEPDRLTWDFGDGTTSTEASPSYAFAEPGQYQVVLRATNDAGTDRAAVNINVIRPVEPPVASFTTSTNTVATGQDVVFTDTSTNNPSSWLWEFESSGEATNQNPFRRWNQPGTYTVRLTVQNEGGRSSSETEIRVLAAPTAAFRVEQESEDTFRFFNEAQNATSFQWDFGDGTTSQAPNPRHRFPAGVFEVTLRTSNDVGSAGPARRQVVVSEPPVARISCSADGPVLTCSGGGSEGATRYDWSANGAQTNSNPNGETTQFTFGNDGRKDVTLVVTNAQGQTASDTIRSPRVTAVREPRISDVNIAEIDGDLVRLSAEFDRDPTNWTWQINGVELVSGGNSPNPTFRVPGPGTYSGFVTAANAVGDDRDPVEFTVQAPQNNDEPEASFEWRVVEPGLVAFVNTSTFLPGGSVDWRFSDDEEVIEENDFAALVRYDDDENRARTVLVIVDDNGRSRAVDFVDARG